MAEDRLNALAQVLKPRLKPLRGPTPQVGVRHIPTLESELWVAARSAVFALFVQQSLQKSLIHHVRGGSA